MERESLEQNVIENSAWYFIMTFLMKVGGLVFTIILARLLLPEKYGIFSLALSIALLILTLTTGGTLKTLSRSVSKALGENKEMLASAYYRFLLKIQFLLSGCSSLILIILAYPLSIFVFKKPSLLLPLILLSVYIAVLYLQNFYEFLFYTIKKVKYLSITNIILQTSKIILLLVFVSLIAKEYQVSAAVLALILSSLITILFLMIFLKKNIPFIFKKSKEKINKKSTINLLISLIFSGISVTIFEYTDMMIIGIFLASAYVGFYSAALTIIAGLYGFISISNVLLPAFTQMPKEKLSEALDKVFKYTSIISIPIIFGILSLGKYFLKFIYGSEYLPAALPLFFLSILIFEFPMTNNLNSVFFARAKPKPVIKVTLLATVLNIILSISLIFLFLRISPIWAIVGAAIATSVSKLFIFVMLSITARRKLKVFYNPRRIIKPLIAGAIMAIFLFLINSQIKDISLLIGILEVFLGALIYTLVLIAIKGLTKQDYLLFKFLKPNFKKFLR